MAYTEYVGGRATTVDKYYWPGSDVERLPTATGFSGVVPKYESFFDRSATRRTIPESDGWREPTPYSLTAWEKVYWTGTFDFCSRAVGSVYDQVVTYNGNFRFSPYIPEPDFSLPTVSSAMINRCETECKLKLKDQNVNYAVALAEARKSLGMIGDRLLRIFEAYSAARKGRWKRALERLSVPRHKFKAGSKDVSSRWLELQYGWLPLLSDVYGAYEDARQGILRHNPRISVQRTIKSQLKDQPWSFGYGLTGTTEQRSSVYGVKVRLDYTLRNQALAASSKIGILNPAEVAWELVPFSFVVDWAVPIGDWISSFDSDFGLTFKGGSRTVFVRVNRLVYCRFAGRKRENQKFLSADFYHTYRYFSMSRSVYSGTPIPLPYWKNPISTAHAANALALLRGLLK